MSTRGRGGKFGKPQRGGNRKFTRNLRPLEDEDFDTPRNPEEADAADAAESSEEEEGGPSEGNVTLSREERRAAARARKEQARKAKEDAPGSDEEGSEEEEASPKPKAIVPSAKLAPGNPNSEGNAGAGGMSRKQREAMEAAAAKERYLKLHAAGKTDEAKSDLARLALIRQEREEKARQRKAELEERKAAADAKVAGRKK